MTGGGGGVGVPAFAFLGAMPMIVEFLVVEILNEVRNFERTRRRLAWGRGFHQVCSKREAGSNEVALRLCESFVL